MRTSVVGRLDPMTDKLRVRDLQGGYGDSQVLFGLDFHVKRGEVVTLLGRNGAGKTSTMRALIGLLPRRRGSILVNGTEAIAKTPEQIVREGIGYCPEERGIFSRLNVRENLLLPPAINDRGMSVDDIYSLFPNLKERALTGGSKLSGGEQQMLAIARVLRTGVDLLLLDEPTEGLAPVIVQNIHNTLVTLKKRGFTILLVEQNLEFARDIASRHYVLEEGRIVDEFDSDSMQSDGKKVSAYLGL
jgi:branched-chain amino acid transport system ATP-binding protein